MCGRIGLLLVAHVGADLGTTGQTPILLEQASRDHFSLIAAIAPNGRIYVSDQDHSFMGEEIVWFLSKLCGRYRKRDLLVI